MQVAILCFRGRWPLLKENQQVTDGNFPTLETGLRRMITVFRKATQYD